MHKDDIIPDCIFKQNFWYSLCQLVNNCKVIHETTLPSYTISAWDKFHIKYPTTIYKVNLVSVNSQCISEACTTVATFYLNNIVELFEAKFLRYILYIY